MNDSWPREPQELELENLTQLFKILGNPSRMKALFQLVPQKHVSVKYQSLYEAFGRGRTFRK